MAKLTTYANDPCNQSNPYITNTHSRSTISNTPLQLSLSEISQGSYPNLLSTPWSVKTDSSDWNSINDDYTDEMGSLKSWMPYGIAKLDQSPLQNYGSLSSTTLEPIFELMDKKQLDYNEMQMSVQSMTTCLSTKPHSKKRGKTLTDSSNVRVCKKCLVYDCSCECKCMRESCDKCFNNRKSKRLLKLKSLKTTK